MLLGYRIKYVEKGGTYCKCVVHRANVEELRVSADDLSTVLIGVPEGIQDTIVDDIVVTDSGSDVESWTVIGSPC
jgi:hypothetical protein